MRIVNLVTTAFFVVHTIVFLFGCTPNRPQPATASVTRPFTATKVGGGCGEYAPSHVELGGTTPWNGIKELFSGDCTIECADDAVTVRMVCNTVLGVQATFTGHDDGSRRKTTDVAVTSPFGGCKTSYVIEVQNARAGDTLK